MKIQNLDLIQNQFKSHRRTSARFDGILDLHVGRVGGEVRKNILSILLWAAAIVGKQHCLVVFKRLVAI